MRSADVHIGVAYGSRCDNSEPLAPAPGDVSLKSGRLSSRMAQVLRTQRLMRWLTVSTQATMELLTKKRPWINAILHLPPAQPRISV